MTPTETLLGVLLGMSIVCTFWAINSLLRVTSLTLDMLVHYRRSVDPITPPSEERT